MIGLRKKFAIAALQEPVRSVAAVGADIIRPRNQLSPRLCDVMRKNPPEPRCENLRIQSQL